MSDSDRTAERLAALETLVRHLAAEVAELRAEARAPRAAGAGSSPRPSSPAPPAPSVPSAPAASAATRPAPTPAPRPQPRVGPSVPPSPRERFRAHFGGATLDVESLVGRYGTIVLAALTITMGVGAFLVWAIAQQRLGPEARVGLGALGSLVVAGAGWHFRRRGARAFGNTLLALALALVHVVAWAAGPRLHVIPEAAAFVIAAAASVALAALAYAEGQQILFVVGFGAALLAPFVTSSGSGRVLLLLSYGWLVLQSALAAVRTRDWAIARRLIQAGCGAYVLAAAAAAEGRTDLPHRLAPATFALACALSALASGGRHASGIVRTCLLLIVPGAVPAATAATSSHLLVIALVGTAALYLELRRPETDPLAWPLAAVGLPAALLATVLVAVPHVFTVRAGLVAATWAAMASAAGWDASGERRGIHLMWAGFAGALALLFPLQEHAEVCLVALTAYCVALAYLSGRLRVAHLLWPTFVVLLLTSAWAYQRLMDRPDYAYTPFLTSASGTALAVVVGWGVVGLLTVDLGFGGGRRPWEDVSGAVPGVVAAFVWGREELSRAYAPDAANFLLILYYALWGVVTIYVGRARRSAAARKVGLALAIFAALKALVQASDFAAIGLRVGSYLLVGGFLLAVGYWYRATAQAGVEAAPEAAPESASDGAGSPRASSAEAAPEG